MLSHSRVARGWMRGGENRDYSIFLYDLQQIGIIDRYCLRSQFCISQDRGNRELSSFSGNCASVYFWWKELDRFQFACSQDQQYVSRTEKANAAADFYIFPKVFERESLVMSTQCYWWIIIIANDRRSVIFSSISPSFRKNFEIMLHNER